MPLLHFEVASAETTQHMVDMGRRTLDKVRDPVPAVTTVLPFCKSTVCAYRDVSSQVVVLMTRRESRKRMRFLCNECMANQDAIFGDRFDKHLKLAKQTGGGAEIEQVPRAIVIDYIAEVGAIEIAQAG